VDFRRAFGTNVRQHRRAAGMTQEGLGDRVGISIETIGKIERGAAAPSFETVERIATALGIAPIALFDAGTLPDGERGRLIAQIQETLAAMDEEQMARAARMLDAFIGR
jgi:transcriptional regulator with XRE-family HTH domain